MNRQIISMVFILLFPIVSLGQHNIANSVELIKKNKVKDVFIYKTALPDSGNTSFETLRLAFSYDTLGRLKKSKEYYKGNDIATYNYYYEVNSFDGIKKIHIDSLGNANDSDMPSKNDVMNFQYLAWSSSDKFIVSHNSKGLLSVILSYSKVIIEKREKGNLIDKDGKSTNDFMYTVDKDDPQYILRFEYTYY